MPDLDGQERESKPVHSRLIPLDDRLRDRVKPELRDYADLYEVEIGQRWAGVTDEYGSCHFSANGFSRDDVEKAVADA
jgi:hypothetical protein